MSASTQPAPGPIRQPVKPGPGPVPVPPPAEPGRPRWRWLLLLLVLGLLGGALYLMLKPSQTPVTGSGNIVRTARATTGPIERFVRITGQTAARHFATIMVPTFRGPDSGRDLTLLKLAPAGSFVKTGEAIAELDGQVLKDHIDDVSDAVRQVENDVLKKKAEQDVEWESLQQNLRVARADLDKARWNWKAAEVKTPIERELLKLSVDEADATYKQLNGDVANTKLANRAEMRITEINVQRQKIHLNNHTGDLRRFSIVAPMDGLVVMMQTFRGGETKSVQQGDQVFPGMQFMKVVDTRNMQVEALASQSECSDFRIGQSVTIGLDAFPGLIFKGKIYSIGAMAVKGMWDTYYVRNVPIRIQIEGSDPRLIPDLSAWAQIHLDGQQNALLIPAEAIRMEGKQAYVFVKRANGTYEKRAVGLGIRTSTQAAVTSGLQSGEEVALGAVKAS